MVSDLDINFSNFFQQRMRQIERNIVDLERSITSERIKINSRFGKDKILL